MKKMLSSVLFLLATASVANAAILPLPSIGSATIYARYNGENVTTSGSDVSTWQNIQPSSFQTTLNASAHTGYTGAITPGLPNLMSSISEINGLPYLRFTRTSGSVGDALRTSTLSVTDQSPSTDKFTIIHVGRINSTTGTDPELYDGVDSTGRKALLLLDSSSKQPTLFTTASGVAPVATPVDGQFHILATVFNGTNSEFWLDGTLISSTLNPGTQSPWKGISIGGRHTNIGSEAFFSNTDFAELLAIRGNLSSTDFGTIGSYLEFKYGLSTAFADVDFTAPEPAPEPASLLLLGLGCVGLIVRKRK